MLFRSDGEEIRKWDGSVYRAVSEAREVTVLREGREVSLTMPEEMCIRDSTDAESQIQVLSHQIIDERAFPAAAGSGKDNQFAYET